MPITPYIIAVAGPSCSGKSTLARSLARFLSPQTVILSIDDYYRDLKTIPRRERSCLNFDSPDALDVELLNRHLQGLASGLAIEKPIYDFTQHTRCIKTTRIAPTDFLIVEGILAMHWECLRRYYRTSVFVDLAQDECLARRLERDVRERGRTPDDVLRQYGEQVLPMCLEHVNPTAKLCEMVVSGRDDPDASARRVVERIRAT